MLTPGPRDPDMPLLTELCPRDPLDYRHGAPRGALPTWRVGDRRWPMKHRVRLSGHEHKYVTGFMFMST